MDMGRQGHSGIAGIYKTDKRVRLFDYSDVVYNELLLVFVRKDEAFSFDSMQDFKGKKIGIILGWSYGDAFDKAKEDGLFTVEEVNRDSLNFKKLNQGRLDCVVASKESGMFEIARNKFSHIIALEKALLINPTYLAFAKHANQQELLFQFNTAMKHMREEGEYRKIVGSFIEQMMSEGKLPDGP